MTSKAATFAVKDLKKVRKVLKIRGETETRLYNNRWLFRDFPDGDEELKIHVIFPVTENEIRKYSPQEKVMVNETPELYEKVVLPYIQQHPSQSLNWLNNIIDEKSETESFLYVDRHSTDGFIILPDSKWDRLNLSTMYLLAIVKRRDIRSLRDLRTEHVPLLRKILHAVHQLVPEKYGIPTTKIKKFIHYQPTYYHFHVHITHIDCDGFGTNAGKAHLLEDVIDNIDVMDPLFYQKKTICFDIGVNHLLYQAVVNTQSNSS